MIFEYFNEFATPAEHVECRPASKAHFALSLLIRTAVFDGRDDIINILLVMYISHEVSIYLLTFTGITIRILSLYIQEPVNSLNVERHLIYLHQAFVSKTFPHTVIRNIH